MSRRKGTPCACECDPCGSKKYIKAINNVSPDPNGDLEIKAGTDISISQTADNEITITNDANAIKTVNNLSPDAYGDFDIKAGSGIVISQTADNEITITNDAIASSFVAGDNIEINPSGNDLEIRVTDDISIQDIYVENIDASGDISARDIDASGDVNVGGTLNVTGDIIQQGAAYETHAEKIFTTNDYIYMRDGAVGGLAVGAFSGFQVKKYDGTNDGRLVIDKDGTARVGNVGDEQPLLTREETANLTDGHLLEWDSANYKAVDAGTDVATINAAINAKADAANTYTKTEVNNLLSQYYLTQIHNAQDIGINSGGTGHVCAITAPKTGVYLILGRINNTVLDSGEVKIGMGEVGGPAGYFAHGVYPDRTANYSAELSFTVPWTLAAGTTIFLWISNATTSNVNFHATMDVVYLHQ